MADYDYIIIGAGAAGLMLADAMGKDAFFSQKKILLLDKDAKQTNDRTWSFWEKGSGDFDSILHRSWDHIRIGGKDFSHRLGIAPYTYKMLRGIDFYNHFLDRLREYPNITFKHAQVTRVAELPAVVEVSTATENHTALQVFNSIFNYKDITRQRTYPVLQQHFIGWFVQTEKPVFLSDTATFMDFSIPQEGNTRFMYVLPFSQTHALVEYTLFSEFPLPDSAYENAIQRYLSEQLKAGSYKVLEKEHGSIPMSCYPFWQHNTEKILYIGTAGGWTKPSTGFTFRNTVKKTTALLEHLKARRSLVSFSAKNRFWWYDLLLLDILYRHNEKGGHIFETLFRKRNPRLLLKFLDEETSIWEDLKVISGCPKRLFINALFYRIWGVSFQSREK